MHANNTMNHFISNFRNECQILGITPQISHLVHFYTMHFIKWPDVVKLEFSTLDLIEHSSSIVSDSLFSYLDLHVRIMGYYSNSKAFFVHMYYIYEIVGMF